jgi:hypothetical protein
MSDLDRTLLKQAGLRPSDVAVLMNRTRQAVSKGLNSPREYFTPANLELLTEAVARERPTQSAVLMNAINVMFAALADRIGASLPTSDPLVEAIADAHRLWLIFPGFGAGQEFQPDAYQAVFEAIESRKPAFSADAETCLEVIAFCDDDRTRVEDMFDTIWFETSQVAIIECDIVAKMMTPIIIVDPHRAESLRCFTLTDTGFKPIAPELAAQRVRAFAQHVTDRVRDTSRDWPNGRPFNAQTASPADILKANVHKI